MRRFNPDFASPLDCGQLIKLVSNTGTPESVYPGTKQVFTIQTVADVSSNLAGKYFDVAINSLDAISRFYFTVGGVGTAPERPVTGRIAVINVVANDTAAAVAAAAKLVVDADAELVATVITDTIIVTQATKGDRALPLAKTSGFTLTQTTAGTETHKFVPSVSLTGQKARGTNNTSTCFFGFSSTNDAQLESIAAGKTVVLYAPEGSLIDLGKIYVDVGSSNDGVLASWPAVERGS